MANIANDLARYLGERPRSSPPTFPRERQARWDRRHLFTVGCRLTTWEARQFNALCQKFGTTKNAVLRQMILHWIHNHMVEDSGNEFS